MPAFLRTLLSPDTKLPRWGYLVLAMCGALLTWYYWTAAVEHGDHANTVVVENDQRVYLNAANNMVRLKWEYSTPRMRMPLTCLMLTPIADPDKTADEIFPTARRYSVFVSLVCLAGMSVALLPWLGGWLTACFAAVAGAQLFILRASYVAPELLLISLTVIAIALVVEVLQRPRWWTALLAGLALYLWYMTKASAMLALAGFVGAVTVAFLFAGKGKRKPYAIAAVIVLGSFFLPLIPYLVESKKVFGSAMYNAQSRYYMWCQDAEEKRFLQKNRIDVTLVTFTPEQLENLPSASKYFREHDANHIINRVKVGMYIMFKDVLEEYPSTFFMLFTWMGIAMWATARTFRRTVDGVKKNWVSVVYGGVLMLLYCMIFGWFVVLEVGPRVILSVCLIPLFFSMAITHYNLRGEVEVIRGTRVSVEKLVALLFLVAWGIFSFFQVRWDLATGYFGS